jgi:hypothetical protein
MPLQKKKKKKTAYKKTGSVTQIVNVNVGSSVAKRKRKKRSSGSGSGVNPMGGLRGQSTSFAQAAPPPQIIYSPQATTESIRGLLPAPAPRLAPALQAPPPQVPAVTYFQPTASLMRGESQLSGSSSRQSSYEGSMYSIDTTIGDAGAKMLRSTSAQSALHNKRGVAVESKPEPLDIPVPPAAPPATKVLHPPMTGAERVAKWRANLTPEQKEEIKQKEKRQRQAKKEQEARANLGSGGAAVMEPINE